MVDENDVAAADFNPNPNPSPNPSPTLTLTPFLTPILNPSLYTRITLQRLVPAPCAGFRLATLSDLPQLLELEAQWDSEFLRSSEATLRQRIELEPSGQFVAFGGDGTLLAAMYTQRVASLEVVQHGIMVQAFLRGAGHATTALERPTPCSRLPSGPERRALTDALERLQRCSVA